MKKHTEKIASATRAYRKLHKWVAVPLFLFLFLIGATGLLLGWKKNVGLLPPTASGADKDAATWVSIDSLQQIAMAHARDSLQKSDKIDRIDIRPGKAIAKIVFADHYSEIQLDCSTGEILAVNARYSDLIENIHDGSIMDVLFKTSGDQAKLAYTTFASCGLILLSFSGFWLWLNPTRIRKLKARSHE